MLGPPAVSGGAGGGFTVGAAFVGESASVETGLPATAGANAPTQIERATSAAVGGSVGSGCASVPAMPWPRDPAEPPQLGQHLAQRLALDVLHHIVASPALAAHAEDGHDVGVVQPARGARLALEPPDLHQISQGMRREQLEGHAAAERALLGLVDDAHGATTDLAEDVVVAQLLRDRSG